MAMTPNLSSLARGVAYLPRHAFPQTQPQRPAIPRRPHRRLEDSVDAALFSIKGEISFDPGQHFDPHTFLC